LPLLNAWTRKVVSLLISRLSRCKTPHWEGIRGTTGLRLRLQVEPSGVRSNRLRA
jgi:hypothetical protein